MNVWLSWFIAVNRNLFILVDDTSTTLTAEHNNISSVDQDAETVSGCKVLILRCFITLSRCYVDILKSSGLMKTTLTIPFGKRTKKGDYKVYSDFRFELKAKVSGRKKSGYLLEVCTRQSMMQQTRKMGPCMMN